MAIRREHLTALVRLFSSIPSRPIGSGTRADSGQGRVVGIFLPQDPGAADELARNGAIAFDQGLAWFKACP